MRPVDPTVSAVATADLPHGPGEASLRLLVFGQGRFATFALPTAGEVVIGRDPRCPICLDEASISRRHARLRLDRGFTVEDLGSANGTRVRGAALEPGQAARITVGELIDLGSVMAVLQRGAAEPGVGAPASPERSGGAVVVLGGGRREGLERLVERVAAGTLSVLILGESGVGKEILAQRLHRLSPRAGGPLLRLNCAALSETLLESELFGHERGAFTGAVQAKVGLLESAAGGTVFLDEAGEMPPPLQAKLLRVLDERKVLPVGGLQPRPIDVRFLAATNRDLKREAEAGRFRLDLYYRLAGITLAIPPLRERRDEIPGLARQFIDRAAGELGQPRAPALTAAALGALEGHPWPGNIRELRNVMERAVLLAAGEPIGPEHLALDEPAAPPAPSAPVAQPPAPSPPPTAGVRSELAELEKRRIVEALEQCAGNQTRAAALLGMSRRGLINRLESYGIPGPRKQRQK